MKVLKFAMVLAACPVLLAGCVVAPLGEPHYDPEVVIVAPPAPRHEYAGYAPGVGYVWIDGYWGWRGYRYSWVPGRWEAPRAGYRWIPHRWDRDGRHWRQHGGVWERDAGGHGRHLVQPGPDHGAIQRHGRDARPSVGHGGLPLRKPEVRHRAERDGRSGPSRASRRGEGQEYRSRDRGW